MPSIEMQLRPIPDLEHVTAHNAHLDLKQATAHNAHRDRGTEAAPAGEGRHTGRERGRQCAGPGSEREREGALCSSVAEQGELCLRGPSLFLGYWQNETRRNVTTDGWWRTGRVCSFSQGGALNIVASFDDVIKVRLPSGTYCARRSLRTMHVILEPKARALGTTRTCDCE